MKKNGTYRIWGPGGGAVRFLLIFTASLMLLLGCENDKFNEIIKNESEIEDLPIPGNRGSVVVSNITSNKVTLSWDSARDENTPFTELQYMVVRSLYDNISDADTAMVNGTVAMEWTEGSYAYTVAGLDPGELFYFNILVKNRDELISAYSKVSILTSVSSVPGLTGTAPVPGDSGLLAVLAAEINRHDFKLVWTKASDTETADADLQYRVYYSLSDDIRTYSQAEANGTQATPGWVLDISAFRIRGLVEGKLYYVNLFVRDGDGMISAYAGVSVTTLARFIYLFSAEGHKGNLGGRVGADKICRNYRNANFPLLPVTHVRAFISVSSGDRISNMTGNYGVPADVAIQRRGGSVIANNWKDLLDGSIQRKLNYDTSSTPSIQRWWSGSNSDGSVSSETCNGFTDDTSSYKGEIGDPNASDSSWISGSTRPCADNRTLLCIGW
jgi:hypothetical protein